MSSLAILFAFGAAIAWAFELVISKRGLRGMDVVAFGFIRPLCALPFILTVGFLTSGFAYPGPVLIGIASLAGVMDSFIGSLLFLTAVKTIPAHRATSLSNTAPFWGVAAAVVLIGESPQLSVFFAAVLVVAGAYLLVARKKSEPAAHSVLGSLGALGAGIMWGVAETGPAKYCMDHEMPPLTFQLIYVSVAALCWGVLALARDKRRRLHFPLNGVAIAALTGILAMFVGWMLWLSGLRLAPASMLAPIRGSMTLFAFMFSVVLLKERPSARSVLGIALVVGGVLLVSILT